jgi:hypothetical protein
MLKRGGQRNARPALIRNTILQLRARTPKIWTAVAERSGDTAFRMTKGFQKRRGASLPAAVQNLWLRLLPRWVYPRPPARNMFKNGLPCCCNRSSSRFVQSQLLHAHSRHRQRTVENGQAGDFGFGRVGSFIALRCDSGCLWRKAPDFQT